MRKFFTIALCTAVMTVGYAIWCWKWCVPHILGIIESSCEMIFIPQPIPVPVVPIAVSPQQIIIDPGGGDVGTVICRGDCAFVIRFDEECERAPWDRPCDDCQNHHGPVLAHIFPGSCVFYEGSVSVSCVCEIPINQNPIVLPVPGSGCSARVCPVSPC